MHSALGVGSSAEAEWARLGPLWRSDHARAELPLRATVGLWLTGPSGRFWEVMQCALAIAACGVYVAESYYTLPLSMPFVFAEVLLAGCFIADYVIQCLAVRRIQSYVLSGRGLADFVSIIPICLVFAPRTQALGFVRALRIFKPARILRLHRALSLQHDRLKKSILSVVFTTAGIFFCAAGAVRVLTELDASSFYNADAGEPLDEPLAFQDALYWVVVTCSTVGFGDLVPLGAGPRLLTCLVIVLFLTLLPTQINKVVREVERCSKFGGKLDSVPNGWRHVVVCGDGCLDAEVLRPFIREMLHSDHEPTNIGLRAVVLGISEPSATVENLISAAGDRAVYLKGDPNCDADVSRSQMGDCEALFVLAARNPTSQLESLSTVAEEQDPFEDRQALLLAMRLLRKRRSFGRPVPLFVMLNGQQCGHSDCLDHLRAAGAEVVFCISDLANSILARSCLCPGFSTFLINMVTSRKGNDVPDGVHQMKTFGGNTYLRRPFSVSSNNSYRQRQGEASSASTKTAPWRCEYLRGSSHEIYCVTLHSAFNGILLGDAALACYRSLGGTVVLFAVMGSSGTVRFCCGSTSAASQQHLHSGDTAFVLARSARAVRHMGELQRCSNCADDGSVRFFVDQHSKINLRVDGVAMAATNTFNARLCSALRQFHSKVRGSLEQGGGNLSSTQALDSGSGGLAALALRRLSTKNPRDGEEGFSLLVSTSPLAPDGVDDDGNEEMRSNTDIGEPADTAIAPVATSSQRHLHSIVEKTLCELERACSLLHATAIDTSTLAEQQLVCRRIAAASEAILTARQSCSSALLAAGGMLTPSDADVSALEQTGSGRIRVVDEAAVKGHFVVVGSAVVAAALSRLLLSDTNVVVLTNESGEAAWRTRLEGVEGQALLIVHEGGGNGLERASVADARTVVLTGGGAGVDDVARMHRAVEVYARSAAAAPPSTEHRGNQVTHILIVLECESNIPRIPVLWATGPTHYCLLDDREQPPEPWLTPVFAAGQAFATSMLGSLPAQCLFNPRVLPLVTALCCGDAAGNAIEQMDIPEEVWNTSAEIGTDLRGVGSVVRGTKQGIDMGAMSSQSDNMRDHRILRKNSSSDENTVTFGILFEFMLARGELPLGLYRCSGHLGAPINFVSTNPPCDARLNYGDKVLVLRKR